MKISAFLSRLGFVCVLGATVPAMYGSTSYINIVATFDSTVTLASNAAAIEGVINQAVNTYNTTLTTPTASPVTINITFAEMSSGLGMSSTPFYSSISYASFSAALAANSSGDATDVEALLQDPIAATNPVTGTTAINVKTANLKALGICPLGCPTTDGTVSLNTHITDVGNTGTSGQYSLLVTTEHEIDEVLGLGSALGSSFSGNPFPEDLFRYTSTPGVRSYTTSTSALSYFSINGSVDLAQFDNQGDGGDWADWQSNPLPGGVNPKVQDAFATPGATPALGPELTALDALGYNLAIPEPGTFLLGGTALLATFLLRRKRQSRP